MSKIMIVDDDRRVRFVLANMLEKRGHEIIEANSGKTCLKILKDEKPDLILMDIMMPGMDGWDVVKEIKKDKSNEGIPISMLSVKFEDKDKTKSLAEAGADWHIVKPVSRDKLLKTIDWLLASQ